MREARGRRPLGDNLFAGSDRLAGQIGDNRSEQLIDEETMPARLRQQRVADHPPIIGVFVDRLGGKFVVLRNLAVNSAMRCGFHGASLRR